MAGAVVRYIVRYDFPPNRNERWKRKNRFGVILGSKSKIFKTVFQNKRKER